MVLDQWQEKQLLNDQWLSDWTNGPCWGQVVVPVIDRSQGPPPIRPRLVFAHRKPLARGRADLDPSLLSQDQGKQQPQQNQVERGW